MNENTLTQLLWRIDPMGTGCAVNEGMEDEYASVARDMAQRLAQGQDANSAVMAEFDDGFWAGCLSEEQRGGIVAAILTKPKRR